MSFGMQGGTSEGPRVVEADNAGPFTLDGTRTFIVGSSVVAIIDPGPDHARHLDRLAREVASAETGVILLTHMHEDHAAGAGGLASRTGFPVWGPSPKLDRRVGSGDRIEVDGGWLEAIETPGHAREHLAYLQVPGRRLFAGDLLLGKGSTTWVGAYSGCVGDYLRSLDRVDALGVAAIHPAHGPDRVDPAAAIDAFRAHRLDRIEQVGEAVETLRLRVALEEGASVGAGVERLLAAVYPDDLSPEAREGAHWSLRAILEHLGIAPFPESGPPRT